MNIYHQYTNISAVEGVKDSYRAELARINSNVGRLSTEGLRIERGRAFVNATRQMEPLRAQFRSKVKSTRERLERQLYGANSTDSGDIVAQRDAQDRAAKLDTDEKALAAWKRAHQSGDIGLQKAIADNANRRGHEDTLTAHFEQFPAVKEVFRALSRVPIAGEIGETALFGLRKPEGFGLADASSIESEIEQSDTDSSPRPSAFL